MRSGDKADGAARPKRKLGPAPIRAAALLLAAAPLILAAAAAAPPPDLGGPLSDFWAKVKRDWSERLDSLNRGPLQTFTWVALVWDAPDEVPMRALADRLQERESLRWVRSQITKHKYRKLARRDLKKLQAMRQNVILMGAPEDNPLIDRALASTPLRVGKGYVSIGPRRISGNSLLLICIVPSPLAPERYALVMTGSTPAAVLAAADVPYGDSDYIVYRGRKVIERGYFRWSAGRIDPEAVARNTSFHEHFGWTTRRTSHFILKYDEKALPREAAEAAGSDLDAALEQAAAFLGIPSREIEPINYLLYASLDEKVAQTGDTSLSHLDTAGRSIHSVGLDLTLPASLLLRMSSAWGPRGEVELPGLAFALRLASQEKFEGRALGDWAAHSTRERDYLPMDLMIVRTPSAPETGDLSLLDAAAFTRWLVTTEGAERVASFYHNSTRQDYRERFRDLFARSIDQAEKRWLEEVPHRPAPPSVAGAPAGGTGLLKQLFRAGRHDEAQQASLGVLASGAAAPEDRAWARVTLGRIHAIQGRRASAIVELRSDEIERGPETVRVLAGYWLETLGQPLNRRAAHAVLKQQAELDLMNFEWEKAEAALRAILANDPLNREVHAALGEVYLSKYGYWHDYMLLDRELFPGLSTADPETYAYLADKGRTELDISESLPPASAAAAEGAGEMPPDNDRFIGLGVDLAAPHFLAGKVHYLQGDFPSARREMETALALEPRTTLLAAWCHLYLGRLDTTDGDLPAARIHYETIVQLAPTGALTKLARQELDKLPEGAPTTSSR